MEFLFPQFWGLSIFVVGLIIFYMFRKQYDDKLVSSNIFWVQVMNEWQATKWWRKLQRKLLLLLQILILLLLMFTLIRPYTDIEGIEGEHIILLLDTSATMTAFSTENKTRFEEAKNSMEELINKLHRDQTVSVISVGETPTLVVNREGNHSLVQHAISNLEVTYEHSDFQRAFSLANALSQQQSSSIYVYSDRITEDLLTTESINMPLNVINFGEETDNNVSVRTFGIRNTSEMTTAIVTLHNESPREQSGNLSILAEGEEVFKETVVVEEQDQTFVSIDGLPFANYYQAIIEYDDDVYSLDNNAYAFSANHSSPVIYLLGEINPFVHRVLHQLGLEIVQASSLENTYDLPPNSLVISTGTDLPEIDKPVLLLTGEEGEKVSLQEPNVLSTGEELFEFVEMKDIYISEALDRPSIDSGVSILQSGDISLIEKGYHLGHPFIHLRFDIQASDWPLHAHFPIFIYNALEFLKGESTHIGYLSPGENRPLHLSTEGTHVVFSEAGEMISEFKGDELFQAPREPGLYYIEDKEEQITYFAVALDDREKQTHSAASFQQSGTESTLESGLAKYEWWTWLLLAGLIVLFMEWEVYRRGIRT
ncbi:vWA domain-containing protein [Evansella tamaricis]|nr:VWA domain-containing protein [Evansella tamaricis]